MHTIRIFTGAIRTVTITALALFLALVKPSVALAQSENTPSGSVFIEGTLCVSSAFACSPGESAVGDVKIKSGLPILFFQNTTGSLGDRVEWFLRTDFDRFRLIDYGENGSRAVEVLGIEAGAPAHSLRILSSGLVGLGKEVPERALHIVNNFAPAIRLEGTSQTWDIEADLVSYAVRDVSQNTRPLQIMPGAPDNVLYISNQNLIGSGTDAPTQAVDIVRSASAARFQLTAYTNDATQAPQYIQRRARGTSQTPGVIQNNDNLGLFSFRGHNGTQMTGSRAAITAQAAGNWTGVSNPTRLTFGTTPVGSTTVQTVLEITPDAKVKINGSTLNVPDFVFEDDYELMPLEELRSFIEENGHLPGIPSADEVNADGLDLAGSQMGQLKKIEELTLYTLQQEARIERQDARIEQLEAQLAQVLAELE